MSELYYVMRRGNEMIYSPKETDVEKLTRNYLYDFYSQVLDHAYGLYTNRETENKEIEKELMEKRDDMGKRQDGRAAVSPTLARVAREKEIEKYDDIETALKKKLDKYPTRFSIETQFPDIFAEAFESFRRDFSEYRMKHPAGKSDFYIGPELKNNYHQKKTNDRLGISVIIYSAAVVVLPASVAFYVAAPGFIWLFGGRPLLEGMNAESKEKSLEKINFEIRKIE